MQFTKSLYLLGIHRLSLNRICKYSEHSWPYLVNNKVTRYCTYDDWWCKKWWRYSHLFQHYSYLLSYTRVLHDMRFNKNTTKDGNSHTATGTVVVTSGTGNNLHTPTTHTDKVTWIKMSAIGKMIAMTMYTNITGTLPYLRL